MQQKPVAVIVSAILVAIGSFLPWASLGIFSAAGTDGDGVFTAALGVVTAGVALAKGRGPATGWTAIVSGGSGILVNRNDSR